MKRLLFLLVFLFIAHAGFSQQHLMYTQYISNGYVLNPAYTDLDHTINATLSSRLQWGGLEGAPTTHSASIHGPVFDNKTRVGLKIAYDKIGVTTRTMAFASYAYQIHLQNRATLSFGLQGGITNYDARFTELDPRDRQDPIFSANDVQTLIPNVGFGLFYRSESMFFGFAIPEMLVKRLDKDNLISLAKQSRHFFGQLGVYKKINRYVGFSPSILIKAVAGAPIEFDINAQLHLIDKISVGVSYRSLASINAIIQMHLSENIRFGYSYDFATLNDLNLLQQGSHEFSLSYRLSLARRGHIKPLMF